MAQERVKEVRAGRGPHGPRPKVKNPGKILKRIMGYVLQVYRVPYIIAVACIVISVVANIQGTLFMQTLIDSYIMPMLTENSTDYSGLLFAILRTAAFYGCGILATFIQSRVMAYLTQGTMKHLRDDLFTHMQTLPIRYFDQNTNGSIMSLYTNDTDTLRQMINQSIPQVLMSALTIIVTFIAMLVLSPLLTLLAVLMICLMFFVSRRIAGNSGKYFVRQQMDLANITATLRSR